MSQDLSMADEIAVLDRYSTTNLTWNKTNLTYKITNGSVHLTTQEEENAITTALSLWSQITVFTFTKVSSSSNADITFSWETGVHAVCNTSFPPNEIAHTLPYNYIGTTTMSKALVHFNDAVDFVYNENPSNQEVDIVHTALHEIGHVLGLGDYNNGFNIMAQSHSSGRIFYADDLQGIWSLYGCPFSISGATEFCQSAVYNISGLPNYLSVHWSTSSPISINSGQGTSSVVVHKTANGYGSLNASIRDIVNVSAATITRYNIYVGPPPTTIGSHILFKDPNGNTGSWSSSDYGNKFSIMTISGPATGPFKAEAYLYRLDNNYNPSQQVWHSSNLNLTDVIVPNYSIGWYLLKVRGYNDCGYSDWIEQEIEIIDTSLLNILLNYDASTETLLVTILEPTIRTSERGASINQSQSSSCVYDIQLWSSTNLVKSYRTDLSKSQISLSGLPKGIYIIRVIKDGKTYSQKFAKRQ